MYLYGHILKDSFIVYFWSICSNLLQSLKKCISIVLKLISLIMPLWLSIFMYFVDLKLWKQLFIFLGDSVVDPDPYEDVSKTSRRIQKNHSGSGQLWIRNKFEGKLPWKTDTFDNFSNKMLILKNINSFFSKKKFPEKLYLVIQCNLTHLEDGNAKVKFMLRILEKFI
jgi:hypothetical protein